MRSKPFLPILSIVLVNMVVKVFKLNRLNHLTQLILTKLRLTASMIDFGYVERRISFENRSKIRN